MFCKRKKGSDFVCAGEERLKEEWLKEDEERLKQEEEINTKLEDQLGIYRGMELYEVIRILAMAIIELKEKGSAI